MILICRGVPLAFNGHGTDVVLPFLGVGTAIANTKTTNPSRWSGPVNMNGIQKR